MTRFRILICLLLSLPALASPFTGSVPGVIQLAPQLDEKQQSREIASVTARLCQQKDFRHLEALHRAYRQHNFKLADGTTALSVVYEQAAQQDVKFRGAWNRADKTSAAPYIVGASAQIDEAWKARGSGWARSVSQASWKSFGQHLMLSHNNLRQALGRDPKDALLFKYWLTTAMGLNQPDSALDKLAQKAEAADPLCFEAYGAYGLHLLPRWGGSVKQLNRWADVHDRKLVTRLGVNGFYAAMRIKLNFVSDAFEEWPLDEARFYSGVDSLCARYPHSLSWCSGAVGVARDTRNARRLYKLVSAYRKRLDPEEVDAATVQAILAHPPR